jgi:hypothetical protein
MGADLFWAKKRPGGSPACGGWVRGMREPPRLLGYFEWASSASGAVASTLTSAFSIRTGYV